MSTSPPSTSTFSPFKLALISSFGAWIADMLLYPIDTIATRIRANKHQFQSFRSECEFIMKNESFKSLYRGFSTTIYCSFIPGLAYFSLYETMNKYGKELCKSATEKHQSFANIKYFLPLFTSPAAELVSLLVYLPFDIVRTRLQVNMREYDYRGIWHGVNHIIEREGLTRMYKASHLYLLNTCIYAAFQMWFYELIRSSILSSKSPQAPKRSNSKQLTLVESVSISIFVTALATAIVNPLDILMTRFQIVDSKVEKLSSIKLLKDLIKNEGYTGFAKGLSTKAVANISLSIVWLPLYDHFKGKYGVDLYD